MYLYSLNFLLQYDYNEPEYARFVVTSSISSTSSAVATFKIDWNSGSQVKTGTFTKSITSTFNATLYSRYEGPAIDDVVTSATLLFSVMDGNTSIATSYHFQGDVTLDTNQVIYGRAQEKNIIVSGKGKDLLVGGADEDTLIGHQGDDVLHGYGGNDTLYGGPGSDVMIGGKGDDTYYISRLDDLAIERPGEGIDSIYKERGDRRDMESWPQDAAYFTLPENIENAYGYFEILTGNKLDNILDGTDYNVATVYGEAGNDRLSAKTMYGGSGNDTYVLDSATDVVSESLATGGSGTDLVEASVSFSLSSSRAIGEIENLTLTGAAAIDGYGNALANVIRGNDAVNVLRGYDGNDTLIGGSGASVIDTLDGGLGNDRFYLGEGNDTVRDAGGSDTIYTKISRDLGDYQAAGIENVTIYDDAVASARGTVGNNKLTGNDAKNTLYGEEGNDTLSGGGGNDKLLGGSGNDNLSGGLGQDIFYFNSKLSGSTNVDRISDFSPDDDTLYLRSDVFTKITGTGTLSSSQFVANSTGLAQDGNDRIIYEKDTGELYYDSNGSGSGGSVLFAILGMNLDLTRSDFFIY